MEKLSKKNNPTKSPKRSSNNALTNYPKTKISTNLNPSNNPPRKKIKKQFTTSAQSARIS